MDRSRKQAQKKQRRRAFFKGHWAELIAAAYLIAKGYRIRARRYKTKVGEVDIIASKKDLVIIVEVKARNSVEDAVNSVTWNSQKRIANTADFWHSRQRDASRLSMRFDIIAVRPWRLPVHLENAF